LADLPATPVPAEDAIAALRDRVAAAGPADTLVIRVPWDITPAQFSDFGDWLKAVTDDMGITNRVLLLPAEQLGVLAGAEDEGQ